MPLTTCPDCGSSISTAAPACIRCGRPQTRREVAAVDTPSPGASEGHDDPRVGTIEDEAEASQRTAESIPFHALDLTKLVVLSICTFSLYDVYWFYRNWKRVKKHFNHDISPFWRAFFAPLWGFSLFREVHNYSKRRGLYIGWSGGFLGLLYLLWVPTWRLPDPWWLITIFSFVPLLPVQSTINEAAMQSEQPPDRTYEGKHIAIIVLGGLFTLLAVIGAFMPVE